MDKYQICAVILNYKAWEETIECVDSLLKMNYENHQIIIVENGSDNDSYFYLSQAYQKEKNVHLIKSDTNLGFAKGNNLGIRYAKENLNADFVYVANSDTIATSDNLYKEIIYNYRKGIGVISPTLIKPDGSYHMPAINCDNIYKVAFRALISVSYAYFFYTIKKRRKKKDRRKQEKDIVIDAKESNRKWKRYVVHGPAYFLTPDFFKYYNCIYPKTFLYWEEINLLMYIRKAQLESILPQTSDVIHKLNKSTDIVFDNKERLRLKVSLLSGMNSVRMFFMSQRMINKFYSK